MIICEGIFRDMGKGRSKKPAGKHTMLALSFKEE
jgi:hypothetical protein